MFGGKTVDTCTRNQGQCVEIKESVVCSKPSGVVVQDHLPYPAPTPYMHGCRTLALRACSQSATSRMYLNARARNASFCKSQQSGP